MRWATERLCVALLLASAIGVATSAPARAADCSVDAKATKWTIGDALFDPTNPDTQTVTATLSIRLDANTAGCRLQAMLVDDQTRPIERPLVVNGVTVTPTVAEQSTSLSGPGAYASAQTTSAGTASVSWKITLSAPGALPSPVATTVTVPRVAWRVALDAAPQAKAFMAATGVETTTPTWLFTVLERVRVEAIAACGNAAANEANFGELEKGRSTCVKLRFTGNSKMARVTVESTNAGRLVNSPTAWAAYRATATKPDTSSSLLFDGAQLGGGAATAQTELPLSGLTTLTFQITDASNARVAGEYKDTVTVTVSEK